MSGSHFAFDDHPHPVPNRKKVNGQYAGDYVFGDDVPLLVDPLNIFLRVGDDNKDNQNHDDEEVDDGEEVEQIPQQQPIGFQFDQIKMPVHPPSVQFQEVPVPVAVLFLLHIIAYSYHLVVVPIFCIGIHRLIEEIHL